ncbi:MAG: HipA N-terminal domain-containing protein, partial [Flavobacteriales bacterium]|nr:HipA N-terminal domain-containing protein [Flavobacteriales bacterium]
MRSAEVHYKQWLAGTLTETDEGDFVFSYDSRYVAEHPSDLITFSMPVTDRPYTDRRLFPFFDGLIPEG